MVRKDVVRKMLQHLKAVVMEFHAQETHQSALRLELP